MRRVIVREGSFSLLDTWPPDNSYSQARQLLLTKTQSIKLKQKPTKKRENWNLIKDNNNMDNIHWMSFCSVSNRVRCRPGSRCYQSFVSLTIQIQTTQMMENFTMWPIGSGCQFVWNLWHLVTLAPCDIGHLWHWPPLFSKEGTLSRLHYLR